MADDEQKPVVKPCRSHHSDGTACEKPRGHKSVVGGWDLVHSGGNKLWTGGIKQPARPYKVDDGYMSEGDEQAYGKFGY